MTTIAVDGATDTLYIQASATGGLEYQINDGPWTALTTPVTVQNTASNPSSEILEVIFMSDLVLTSDLDYFIAGSDGIQFGNEQVPIQQLRNAAGRTGVTVVDVSGYRGFVQNGTEAADGYNNITITNIDLVASGSTAATGAGWIGQEYIGKNARRTVLIDCHVQNVIDLMCGYVIGDYAACGPSAILAMYRCSSTGMPGDIPGGILGPNSGLDGGYVYCEECW